MARIAFITSTFPDYQKCGTGIYAAYLAEALASQGHDVHIITSAIPEIRASYGKVTVHKLLQNWNPLELHKLIEAFYKIKPDIIHINHPTAIAAAKSKVLVNLLPEINRHLWKLPMVTTLHEFGNVSLLGKLKIFPLVHGSDVVTVTSSYYKKSLEKFFPHIKKSKIQVVNIGSMFKGSLKTSDGVEQRSRWGLQPQDKVVGFIGFISPPKGFHNLIQALASYMRADRHIKILALSSWNQTTPAYRQKILDQIQTEDISSQVIFTGYLEDDDMWATLQAVNVCAFAFDHPVEERSSGPLRQAIDRGLPTVVFAKDLNYNEFGFENRQNIWLVPFKRLDIFGQDVVKLLNDVGLQSQLSEGAKLLRQAFSFDSVSNSMSRIYSQLLTKSN